MKKILRYEKILRKIVSVKICNYNKILHFGSGLIILRLCKDSETTAGLYLIELWLA
jgi:hypothetical protein